MKITVVMATLLFDVVAKHGKQKVKVIYSKCNPNLTFLFTTQLTVIVLALKYCVVTKHKGTF